MDGWKLNKFSKDQKLPNTTHFNNSFYKFNYTRLEQLTSRPKMKPFHELRYGGSDASQRGIFFSSGQEWSEQRKFSMWQLKDLGFGKSAMEVL